MIQFNQVSIATTRLLLRPLQQADASAVFALRSNPKVSRFTGYVAWTDLTKAQELIARDQAAMECGEYLRLGMVPRGHDELIGTVTLFHLDAQCRRAEIGYDLHPAMWGKAYMNEALLALLELGFNEMMLNRIEADVDPHNTASINTLQRLGFLQEGLMRERWIVDGVKFDTAFFGLLHADWMKSGTI